MTNAPAARRAPAHHEKQIQNINIVAIRPSDPPAAAKKIRPSMPHPHLEMWREYRSSRSRSARHQLLNAHIDLIRSVAVKLSARLPGCVDLNDLIQEGFLGLDKAIDAFDPDRGVQFSTFAVKRIWGAMMDGLRGDDWQRRTDRRRTQRIDNARHQLAAQDGRPPTDDEIAAHLGVSQEQYVELWKDARSRSVRSLWTGAGSRPGQSGDMPDCRELLPIDMDAEDPTSAAQRTDLLELLVKGFTRAERLLVVLYYYEDMTMKEIGQTLAISESRVSQMHSLLVQRIKAALHGKLQEFF